MSIFRTQMHKIIKKDFRFEPKLDSNSLSNIPVSLLYYSNLKPIADPRLHKGWSFAPPTHINSGAAIVPTLTSLPAPLAPPAQGEHRKIRGPLVLGEGGSLSKEVEVKVEEA